MLPPPDPTRRVAYELHDGSWYFRDPLVGGHWRWTPIERTALRWGAQMFRCYR